jgi:hypothetical protein
LVRERVLNIIRVNKAFTILAIGYGFFLLSLLDGED